MPSLASVLLYLLGTTLASPLACRDAPNDISSDGPSPATISTASGEPAASGPPAAATGLSLQFQNNFSPTATLYAYAAARVSDKANMLQAGGATDGATATWMPLSYSMPASVSVAVPTPIDQSLIAIALPQSTTLGLTFPPDEIAGGRIWVSDGPLNFSVSSPADATGPGEGALTEPSVLSPIVTNPGTNWGFVELTNNGTEMIVADVSFVDFVGLPLGLVLESSEEATQKVNGVGQGGVEKMCTGLLQQEKDEGDDVPWSSLCVPNTQSPIRVLSPMDYLASASSDSPFGTYFDTYIQDVWSHYSASNTSNQLILDVQDGTLGASGLVTCSVQTDDNNLHCAGDENTYPLPHSPDIFNCNQGTFANPAGTSDIHQRAVPRLCAAFNRGTLLLDLPSNYTSGAGHQEPFADESQYYTGGTANHYCRVVHEVLAGNGGSQGYTFAYDDSYPADGVDPSGRLISSSPVKLTVVIG